MEALECGSSMQPAPRRSAQHEVFQYGEARNQLNVLKDGSDAEIKAFTRRANFDQLSVHANRASVRLLQAGKYTDEGRFSRSILAKQNMYFTGEDIERDVVVRHYARKPLGNAAQLNCRAAIGDGCRWSATKRS